MINNETHLPTLKTRLRYCQLPEGRTETYSPQDSIHWEFTIWFAFT